MPIYEWNFAVGKTTNLPLLSFLGQYAAEARGNHTDWSYWCGSCEFDTTGVYLLLDKGWNGFVMYDEFASGVYPAPFDGYNTQINIVVDDTGINPSAEFIARRVYLSNGLPRYLVETKTLTEYLENVSDATFYGYAQFDFITSNQYHTKEDNPSFNSKSSFLSSYGNYKIITDIKAYTPEGIYIGSLATDNLFPLPFVKGSSSQIWKLTDGQPDKIRNTRYVYYFNALTGLCPHISGNFSFVAPYANGNVLDCIVIKYGNSSTSLVNPLVIFSPDKFEDTINEYGGIQWTDDPQKVVDPGTPINNPDYVGPQFNPSGGSYVIGGGDDPQPEGTEFTGGNYDPNSAVITTQNITPPGFSPSSASGISTWAVSGDELFQVTQEIFKPEIDLSKIFISKDKAFVNAFYLPFDIQQHDSSHCSLQQFNIGYATTTLQLFRILGGYNNTFDGGSVNVREYYGTFLDYAPYTSVVIYIPYIGYHELDTNIVMNRTVNLKFSVDLTMGILTAFIFAGNTLIDTLSGQMGIPMSINGMDLAEGFQSLVKFIGMTAVSVPAIASPAAGLMSGAMESNAGILGGAGVLGAVTGVTALAAGAGASNALPPAKQMGTAGAENWLTAFQTPYILIERREDATPAEMVNLEGYASCYTATVSKFTGYVQASTIKLQNAAGITEEENNMILDLLRGGIYID